MTSTAETLSTAAAQDRGCQDPIVRRVPFFYGWLMLPVAMVAQVATSPGQTFGISVFTSSFRESLGLSHSQLTGAYLLGTLLASLPVPMIGGLMDRFGMRRMILVVVTLLGMACLFTSQISGLISLFFAFLLLRMIGQGVLTLLAANTLAMWFHDRLGTVLGMTSMAMAGAIAIVPPLLLHLIDSYGWRATYAIMGVAVWVIVLPIVVVFYRNRPEDVGQVPDGRGPKRRGRNAASTAGITTGSDFDLEAAIRTRSYWILLANNAVWGLVATAIVFHIVSICDQVGLSRSTAAGTFTTFAVFMALMQLVGGLLADRVALNVLLTVGVSGLACGVIILIHVDQAWEAHFYAATFGASQGLVGVSSNTAWARYFGRTHLGKIRGSTWTAAVAGSAIGPFIMGLALDHFGSYQPALWLFVGMFVPMALAALLATPPTPRIAEPGL